MQDFQVFGEHDEIGLFSEMGTIDPIDTDEIENFRIFQNGLHKCWSVCCDDRMFADFFLYAGEGRALLDRGNSVSIEQGLCVFHALIVWGNSSMQEEFLDIWNGGSILFVLTL